ALGALGGVVLLAVVVVVVVVLVVAGWFVVTYNGLVRLRNRLQGAWAQIDVQLRRRYDLIPNLVATVKGYATHEQAVFTAVTQARAHAVASTGRPSMHAADENQLVGTLNRLFAVAEAYPKLRASENFLQLQNELSLTEDRIQAARRFYNANVRDYRNQTRQFPGVLFAGTFHMGMIDFFEIESPAFRVAPTVGFDPVVA
ncbi:MAG: LemA family protein, partial [Thermoplasmatota archaeon]